MIASGLFEILPGVLFNVYIANLITRRLHFPKIWQLPFFMKACLGVVNAFDDEPLYWRKISDHDAEW